jgi:hypothetical protein
VTWIVDDLRRFRDERQKIDTLEIEADWLKKVGWRLDSEGRLNYDAEIVTAKQSWPVTLRYPNHFPHQPPQVLPRDRDNARWSNHQWGIGGELCTEWGPDNWTPDMKARIRPMVHVAKSPHVITSRWGRNYAAAIGGCSLLMS